MKTVILEYKSKAQLGNFIQENNLLKEDNLLVQVFTSINQKSFIQSLITDILSFVPKANLLGSTTCGEISSNGSLTDSVVLSFSSFANTKIETKLVNYNDSSFKTGQNLIKSFDYKNEDLKLLISFSDGLNMNGEEYLNGISDINTNITVSGGMAGDNAKFEETFVFTQDNITNNGAVAAALYNKDLNIYTDYSFNWESVGKTHIVTKSEKNRVYKIGDQTPIEFYKYYLGEDIAKLLPAIGIEFPLVIKKDGITIARAILDKHNDGSLSFAGNIPEGSVVQFGHGDVQMIINKGIDNVKGIIDHSVESIFVYSCMARRSLLQEDINLELLPLSEIAPVSGFFTYGEFYHNCKDQACSTKLLNQTMTIVAISENNKLIDKVSPNIFSHNPPKVNDSELHRTQALSNLIERTTKELEELNNDLEKRVQEEVKKNNEKDSMMQIIQSQAQLGEMMEMIIHQWRQPLSAVTSTVSSTQIYQETGLLNDDDLAQALKDILSYTDHLNSTIEDFREFFKADTILKAVESNQLLAKALTIIDPIIKKHNINLIREDKYSSTINISIGLAMQVIVNIVKNAVDILLEKEIKEPKIKFNTFEKDNNVIIEILDNGGGIPEDILPKIFDKRFSTKLNSHGTGIGLDMSKTIIETKLNGQLTASNRDGWAVFTISLPFS